ncbi:MAG: class I SAM-dependent methyltransferase [Acidobacteria bacterium]|nr:class I SAM-dependent methyltransferase [Acidobacteriota bacterium]
MTQLKRGLERVGLLRPAYELQNWLRARRLRRGGGSSTDTQTGDDGLPIPPPELLVAIGGQTTVEAYLQGGIAIAAEIESVLADAGTPLDTFTSVLDFGCGCGRLLRRFRRYAEVHHYAGTDYNPALIAWCQAHLPFARFDTNALEPPLRYADGTFDLVYSFSVFTHFSDALQRAWLAELRRILKPGGALLLTLHLDPPDGFFSAAESGDYAAGRSVVRYASLSGSNITASFHPMAFITSTMAEGWDLRSIRDSRTGQRFVLLGRPA